MPSIDPTSQALDPTALTPQQLARMLGLPLDTVQKHLDRGAPAAADGRVNLVHYAAWLNKELKSRYGE